MTNLADLLHRGDLDELVREVDRLANLGDWDTVLLVRNRCLEAAETLGKQLWGVSQYAEYRTALQAPARVAASVVVPGAARFALGPLTEVVAQHHAFDEVADHLDSLVVDPVAQERVLQGEDLRRDPRPSGDDGPPLALEPWEPRYAVPTYEDSRVLAPSPPLASGTRTPVRGVPGPPRSWPLLQQALEDLVAPWATQSSGEAHVVVVTGDAPAAVAALVPGDADLIRVDVATAFAWMQWAAASGGARGRRRGGAAGRAAAWWVGHVAAGTGWPPDPDDLEFHLEDLRWYLFEDGSAGDGWRLRLAVDDPAAGWAAAVDAEDTAEDDEEDHHG